MAEEFDNSIAGGRARWPSPCRARRPRVPDIFNKTRRLRPMPEIKPLLAASHYLLGEFKLHGANLRDQLPKGVRTCMSMCRRSSMTIGGC